MTRSTLVFGPAYLDRVLLTDRALIETEHGGPVDQSVDGAWKFGSGLRLVDPRGGTIDIALPPGWPAPTGEVALSRAISKAPAPWRRVLRGVAWHDDLGGMGAGYAAALDGTLVSALGEAGDPASRLVAERLAAFGIKHHAIRVAGHEADWTLLVTSGPFGDKLPIGFRGCHAAVKTLAPSIDQPCDLRVVASLPNRLAAEALRATGAAVRFYAPAMHSMLDRECPVSGFVRSVDVLSCNRHEWESLPDREEVAWQLSLLAVTDGSAGSLIRFTDPQGDAVSLRLPAFPRSRPPRDTNRAGEAFAATLLTTLLDAGWSPGVADPTLVRHAAERASAAAALVLDRAGFGFPSADEISEALRRPQRRHHSVATIEQLLRQHATKPTRRTGDQPRLRHRATRFAA